VPPQTITEPAPERVRPEPSGTSAAPQEPFGGLAYRGLHLVVLTAFGVSRPLFTDLDDGMLFLVLDWGPTQIVLLALLATLAPPAALLAIEALAGIWSRRAEYWLHLCFVAGLASVFASQLILDRWDPSNRLHALLSVAAGLAFALAYAKGQPIRSILTVLAPLPILAICLFLFFSPVEKVAFAGQGDPPAEPVRLPNPVVMIILDEMQGQSLMDGSRHIDASRFPNFARLAHNSTWFRNATTAHSFTEYAVPSIVTGHRSTPDSRPIAADHQRGIFNLLGANPMTVQEPFTDLCPRSLCPATGSALDVTKVGAEASLHQWLPDTLADRIPTPQGENDPAAETAQLVSELGRTDEPALHYFHVLLPHSPYAWLPSGRRHASRRSTQFGLKGADRWDPQPWPVVQAHQEYLLQLMYTDRLLGKILDRLEATGMYDRSLVMLMADHGVSFHAGGSRREVTPENYEDIMSVPFFVKVPGQKTGRVNDQFIRNLDAVPTIMDSLGLKSPWRFQGQSVFTPRTDPNPALDIRTIPGTRLSFKARTFVRRRDAAVRAQIAQFGTSESDLYRIGPHSALIGRKPEGTRRLETAAIALESQSRPFYDPRAEDVPVHVQGTVVGPAARDVREIAVAVNGVVEATTRTVSSDGEMRFSALVPESQLRRGANRIELYEISPGPRLARIRAH
jgi:hypothetical protein